MISNVSGYIETQYIEGAIENLNGLITTCKFFQGQVLMQQSAILKNALLNDVSQVCYEY